MQDSLGLIRSPAETVALGAADAAGLTVGYWTDRAQLRANWHRVAEWTPQMRAGTREVELARWRHAVELAILWSERPVPDREA